MPDTILARCNAAEHFHRDDSRGGVSNLSRLRPHAAGAARSDRSERPRDLPEARDLSAHRLLQDSRRDERDRATARPSSCRTASGRSAPATPRRASRWPRARPARARRCWSWTRRRPPRLRAIERLGATIVKATHDECWKAVEAHASDRMTGQLRPSVRRRRFHQRERHGRAGDSRRPAGRGCGDRADRRRRAARRHRLRDARAAAGRPRSTPPSRRPPRRCRRRWPPAHPMRFEGWTASFVDGAGGRSVLPSMWPLLEQWVDASIVVSLDEAAARDEAGRRTLPRHRRRRRRVRHRRRQLAADS